MMPSIATRISTTIALLATLAIATLTPATRAVAQSPNVFGGAAPSPATWYPQKEAFNAISGIRWNDVEISRLLVRIGRDVLVFGMTSEAPDEPTGALPVALGYVEDAARSTLLAADSALVVTRGSVSLFRVNVDGGANFGGTYDADGSGDGIPVEGAGTRMMWYPRKGAFRAGGISGTQWDAANIGDYSVAIGQDVRASANNAVAFGLRSTAAQVSSFAAGEDNTASGAASVALGYHAHTNARQGSFVFSDRSSIDTLRAGINHSANWRVSGGFRVFTSSNLSTGVTIQSGATVSNWGQSNAVISTSTGAMLTSAGVWQNASDVHRKRGFADISGEEILGRLRAVPIRSWRYNVEDDGIRHVGPTAQDFRAAFGLGTDSLSIGTVDADGVALASVQALDARTIALRAENDSLRARLGTLEERLARLEALLRQAPPKDR